MAIRDLAATDLAALAPRDLTPVTLTATDGTEYETYGFVKRIDAVVDPQTDQQFHAAMLAVTVPTSGLAALPEVGWEVTTTDVIGNNLTYRVQEEPRIDRTAGRATLVLEEYVDG